MLIDGPIEYNRRTVWFSLVGDLYLVFAFNRLGLELHKLKVEYMGWFLMKRNLSKLMYFKELPLLLYICLPSFSKPVIWSKTMDEVIDVLKCVWILQCMWRGIYLKNFCVLISSDGLSYPLMGWKQPIRCFHGVDLLVLLPVYENRLCLCCCAYIIFNFSEEVVTV